MKSTTQIKTVFLALVAVVMAFAGAAKAQSPYQGKITLPEATRWGHVELPAGDYTFSVKPTQTNIPLIIVSDAHGKSVAMTQPMTTDATAQVDGKDCLVLERDSKGSFISQVRIGSSMVVFSYAPKGHSKGAEESRMIRIDPTGRPTRSGSRS